MKMIIFAAALLLAACAHDTAPVTSGASPAPSDNGYQPNMPNEEGAR